ncbi:aldehyde dehydrogenase family protein [Hydrogenophaga sp. YM1]|uniref:aldehyde dehydrogenase family protein n=1 Tax=Hydrogenophaga sp. YM1 TaxID=2806262 RepID=UPI00195E1270|nr:aldehyde dehydrogenase family protein [Hydrogenophaga sp. YM1]QRR34620.1 aldehyde dehydrogenase family protein [Hydrogenophaga sp. YM1]
MASNRFFIGGAWVVPRSPQTLTMVDPADGRVTGQLPVADAQDVDAAVRAAAAAFPAFSQVSVAERLAILERTLSLLASRQEDLAQSISREMGAPITVARQWQATIGLEQLREHIAVLRAYRFSHVQGRSTLVREPIGVCALITPWNWPLNQMVQKVAPAIAAGCTMVLKPSEATPGCADILAEVLVEAGLPAGVFNLVHGTGALTGQALVSHPLVDLVSFTGSTRGGIAVAKAAADTIKRVSQELGGKSPCLVLPDGDLTTAVSWAAEFCFFNSGQSCNAPTRLLVPRARMAEAAALARQIAERQRVGHPALADTTIGPVVNRVQRERIEALVRSGLDEGAELVAGGPDCPPGLEAGCFVRPTVFANVDPGMRVACEEIFGPVLSILAYDSVDEAVDMANDSEYGLHAFVFGADAARTRSVATRLRAGQVGLNGAPMDWSVPFGGYRQSGNGREGGVAGLEEYLEIKAIVDVAT